MDKNSEIVLSGFQVFVVSHLFPEDKINFTKQIEDITGISMDKALENVNHDLSDSNINNIVEELENDLKEKESIEEKVDTILELLINKNLKYAVITDEFA